MFYCPTSIHQKFIVIWCHNIIFIYFRFLLNEYENVRIVAFGIMQKYVDICAMHLLLKLVKS